MLGAFGEAGMRNLTVSAMISSRAQKQTYVRGECGRFQSATSQVKPVCTFPAEVFQQQPNNPTSSRAERHMRLCPPPDRYSLSQCAPLPNRSGKNRRWKNKRRGVLRLGALNNRRSRNSDATPTFVFC